MTPLEQQRFEVRLRAIHCDPQRFVDKYPDDAVAICALVARKIQRCDWRDISLYTDKLRNLVKTTDAYTDSTFCYIGTSQEEQYVNMLRGTKARYPNLVEYDSRRTNGHAGKINIGYLSSDFHEHATAYLIARLFELHDRKRFKIFAFSCGADDHSPMRERLRAGVDEFIDFSSLKDYVLASDIIKSHNIDILVDLKGYTAGHCADITAMRPAPILVNYLGWPSTTGGLCDYIIADRTVIPAQNRKFFSEKVVWLPGSYQINDDKQVSGETLSRAEYGLPRGIVYSNFNQAYKITPDTWKKWMTRLAECPEAALWQYQVQPEAMENLRAEAQKYGVDPSRIITARHINRESHLARYGTVDIAFDTQPVCGHTTTSDAIRMGHIPLLEEREHDAFISNVTNSLVAHADTLFDATATTSAIERCYDIMWQRHSEGSAPSHIE